MKLLHILLFGVVVSFLGWLLWIISKPGRYRLMPQALQEQLNAMLPVCSAEGNALQIFTDGESLRDAVLADLQTTYESVHMQFFKFEDDATGNALADIMADKVAAGAEARLLYDDFVCQRWHGFYHRIRQRGVQAVGFNPVHWPVPVKRDYYRNHRKCIVLDGRVAYLGGYNLADRYVHGLDWGRWRDTMVRIEGPAVAQVQHIFLADWFFATGVLPPLRPLFPELKPRGPHRVRVLASGPIGYGPTLLEHSCRLLDGAQRYVWFESPYFLPPTPLRQSILRAAARGVDVRVLQPPRGDRGETTQLASKSFYAEAMQSGVHIGVYEPGFLHSKIIVADDTVGVVGSCNIDPRSHYLCEEMVAEVHGAPFVHELKEVFLADEAQSHYIDPSEWQQRPLRQRLGEAAARTLTNLL